MIKINLLNKLSPHADCYKTAWLLALSAHTKGKETTDHIIRVGQLSTKFACFIRLPEEDISYIGIGAVLHDIGKLCVNANIINKKGKLDSEEWIEMKTHAASGGAIMRSVNQFPEESCLIAEQHHEKWDGSGYPFGIKNKSIYIGARLFSIIDSFDAMTNDRCYRNKRGTDLALEELKRCSSTQFDPDLVKLFERFIYA